MSSQPPYSPSCPTIPTHRLPMPRAFSPPTRRPAGERSRARAAGALLQQGPRPARARRVPDEGPQGRGGLRRQGRAPARPGVVATSSPSADLGFKKQPMLDVVHDFEVLECEGEWEALLTENRLIKDIRPRFNVRLTDDKTFPYLAVTHARGLPARLRHAQPARPGVQGREDLRAVHERRARCARRCSSCSGCSSSAPATLDIVEGDPKNRFFRPCLLYNIGQCTAPCAAKIAQGAVPRRHRPLRPLPREQAQRHAPRDARRDGGGRGGPRVREGRDAARPDQGDREARRARRARAEDRWQPETESLYIDPQQGPRAACRRRSGWTSRSAASRRSTSPTCKGGETVGSKVCFVDGRPFKNEYRRYRIKQRRARRRQRRLREHPRGRQPPLPRGRRAGTSCTPM